MSDTGTPPKDRRIVGQERASIAKDMVTRHTAGDSFRVLAVATGPC